MQSQDRSKALEEEAAHKALSLACGRADWRSAEELLGRLGSAAWSRPNLMGSAPWELSLAACWREGSIPGSGLLALVEAGPFEFDQAEAFVAKLAAGGSPSADGGEGACVWMASIAPEVPRGHLFEFMARAPLGPAVLGAWARKLAERARAGELGPSWRGSREVWSMAAKAPEADVSELAKAFSVAGLRAPLREAASGAGVQAAQWIGALAPKSALALLAAVLSETPADWSDFESLGAGVVTEEWRVLASAAAGLPAGKDFNALGVGRGWSELRNLSGFGAEAEKSQEEALMLCARVAAPAAESVGGVRAWILERAGARVAAVLAREGPRWDFASRTREQVMEEIHACRELDDPRSSELGCLAAERLWELRKSGPKVLADGLGGFDEAAGRLWRSASPEAFEAFGSRLGELAGNLGEAARLCGMPLPLLGRECECEPGSPGHLVALARVFPMDVLDASGERLLWSEKDARFSWVSAMWSAVKLAALVGRLEESSSSGWSGPLPEPLGPPSGWGPIDLATPKWRASARGEQRSAGWESAMEAVAELALASGSSSFHLPEPGPFETAEDPPTRMAWRVFARAQPAKAAMRMAELWLGMQDNAAVADRIAGGLGLAECSAVARELPRAFEAVSELGRLACRGGSLSQRMTEAEAARRAGRALGRQSDAEAFDEAERLCAACMAGAAYGLSIHLRDDRYRYDVREKSTMVVAVRDLRSSLPRAAAALSLAGWEAPEGPEGFSPADLTAKAAWASLALESSFRGPGRGAWIELWSSLRLEPASPWARSAVSALFSLDALEEGDSDAVSGLARAASCWLTLSGCDGLERLPGGRSALELAVDCRPAKGGRGRGRDEASCFGPAAVAALISLGADPSDPLAPSGADALALCAGLERRESPATVMKELLKSPKARPGSGSLWGQLSDSKKNKLSEKLTESLRERASAEPTLQSLAMLGSRAGQGRDARRFLDEALLGKGPARALAASGLLAEMARRGAPAESCKEVRGAMRRAGIEPGPGQAEALARWGLVPELLRADVYSMRARLSDWAAAGATESGPLARSELPPELAREAEAAGLGERASCASICAARAIAAASVPKAPCRKGHGLACDQIAHWLLVGCELYGKMGGDTDAPGLFAKALDLCRERGVDEEVREKLSPAQFAQVEALSLGAVGLDAKAKTAAKRI